MAASDVDSLMSSAATALAGGDYDAALSYGLQALARAAAIPDSDHSGSSMRWDRRAIENFITECRKERGLTGGLVRRPVEYVRTETITDFTP
jgi:hypothetical protein